MGGWACHEGGLGAGEVALQVGSHGAVPHEGQVRLGARRHHPLFERRQVLLCTPQKASQISKVGMQVCSKICIQLFLSKGCFECF